MRKLSFGKSAVGIFVIMLCLFSGILKYATVYAEEADAGTQYQIEFSDCENGFLQFSDTDYTEKSFSAGDKVTITAIPDAWYLTDNVTAETKGKEILEVTKKDAEYMFTMPDDDVVITAEFVWNPAIPIGRKDITGEDLGTACVVSGEDAGTDTDTDAGADADTDVGADAGIMLFSTVGSNCTITPGTYHAYGSWSTCEFKVTSDTGNHLGYCAQPNSSTPSGVYKVSALNNNLLKIALMLAPGGPWEYTLSSAIGKPGLSFFYDTNVAGGNTYANAHAVIGYIYSGQLTGLSAAYANGVKNMAALVTNIYNNTAQGTSDAYHTGIDPNDYKAYVAYNNQQDIVWLEKVVSNGSIALYKSSANTTFTNFNNCYSYEGAEYGVYSGSTLVGKIVTDASGYGRLDNIPAGSYTIKELTPSKGYSVNITAVNVTVTSGLTSTVNVKEYPQNNPISILLRKIDSENEENHPQGSAELAGAQFRVDFYAGDKAPSVSGATKTWILETDEDGYVRMDNVHKVSGDEFYYNTDGDAAFPLGTVTVQEIKAPPGYALNNEIYVMKIESEGTAELVETYNAPVIPENVLRLDVMKILQGTDEKISGAVFRHTLPDGTAEDVTTDENGSAGFVGLTDGQHVLEEISVLEGYTLNPGKITFTVSNREARINYSAHQQTFGDLAVVSDGEITGITGEAKRLEAITISKGAGVEGISGDIKYRVSVESDGVLDWVTSGKMAGTTGESKRIEAVQIVLTGSLAQQYDIYYRTHIQSYGWLQWTKGSDSDSGWSGSKGLDKSVQALQIVMVRKGEAGPDNSDAASAYSYKTSAGGNQQTYDGRPLSDIQAESKGKKITVDSNTSTEETGFMTFTASDAGRVSITVEDVLQPFKLLLHKQNESGNVLKGAEFTLYSDKACKKELEKVTTNAKGEASFENLEVGITYYLKETKAPKGYKIPINADGSDLIYEFRTESDPQKGSFEYYVNGEKHTETSGAYAITGTKEEREVNLTVINRTSPELPETGSHVPLILALSGICLMAIGIIYYLLKRKG